MVQHNNRLKKKMLFAWLSKMNWRVALGHFLGSHLQSRPIPEDVGIRSALSSKMLITTLAVRVYYQAILFL